MKARTKRAFGFAKPERIKREVRMENSMPRTPRFSLFRFQSKVWLDMQCRCMSSKPEAWGFVLTTC